MTEKQQGSSRAGRQGLDNQSVPASSTLAHLKRARANPDAWFKLFAKVEHYVSASFRRSSLPNTVGLDDVVQEVVMEIYDYLPNLEFESRGEFWKYVHKVAGHKLADSFRREAARIRGGDMKRVDCSGGESQPELEAIARDPQPHASEFARANEYAQRFHLALQKLSAPHRLILEQVILREASTEEIAAAAGQKQVSVRARLSRARAELRRHLGD